jgi:hypothetical protein
MRNTEYLPRKQRIRKNTEQRLVPMQCDRTVTLLLIMDGVEEVGTGVQSKLRGTVCHFNPHSLSEESHPQPYLVTAAANMGSIANEERQSMKNPSFPFEANTIEYAKSLDAKDHLRSFREKFIIPSKSNIKSKRVVKPGLFLYFIILLL